MPGKILKLQKIMKKLCNEIGIKEFVDITMTENPARIYFTFKCRPDGFYFNTTRISMEDVCKVDNVNKGIADKYGLIRANSDPKYKVGGIVALGFKLKSMRK